MHFVAMQMRAVAGGPLSTITLPTTFASPLVTASTTTSQRGIAALPTPRIDSLLASRHRRQQQRELVQALHVDHRLERLEHTLAALNQRKPLSTPKQRPTVSSDGERSDEGQASDVESKLSSARQPDRTKRRHAITHTSHTQTEPSDEAVPVSQSPPLPSYEQLQQQMVQLQAELSAARKQRWEERETAEARQRETERRLGEAEGQLQEQASAALQRMKERDEHEAEARKWRDECNKLSGQHLQAVLDGKQREAEARSEADRERRLHVEAQKQSEDQLEQQRRQLSQLQADEAKVRIDKARLEAEVHRMQIDVQNLSGVAREREQSGQRLTADVSALSQQLLQLQSHTPELQQQARQAKEAEAVATERLARDRLLWEENRRQLSDALAECEQRLAALSAHYVDKQRDVSDLKELCKLSVRNEREARREADEARDEAGRRAEQLAELQRQWQRERAQWQQERDKVQQQAYAHQLEVQAAGDARGKLLLVLAEVAELKKQADRSADTNLLFARCLALVHC